MTTTEKRDRQVVKIADAAMMVDVSTGEVLAERTKVHPVSQPAVSAKKAPEKLPFNAVVVEGATCPECGGKVAHARMNGKQFEVCMKQFSEEPECWYAREIPKDGDGAGAVDGGDGEMGDGSPTAESTGGDEFFDGGGELGGAQMKTAAKTEGAADGDTPSGKTSKKGKGKK